jgi:hypothetical protein
MLSLSRRFAPFAGDAVCVSPLVRPPSSEEHARTELEAEKVPAGAASSSSSATHSSHELIVVTTDGEFARASFAVPDTESATLCVVDTRVVFSELFLAGPEADGDGEEEHFDYSHLPTDMGLFTRTSADGTFVVGIHYFDPTGDCVVLGRRVPPNVGSSPALEGVRAVRLLEDHPLRDPSSPFPMRYGGWRYAFSGPVGTWVLASNSANACFAVSCEEALASGTGLMPPQSGVSLTDDDAVLRQLYATGVIPDGCAMRWTDATPYDGGDGVEALFFAWSLCRRGVRHKPPDRCSVRAGNGDVHLCRSVIIRSKPDRRIRAKLHAFFFGIRTAIDWVFAAP